MQPASPGAAPSYTPQGATLRPFPNYANKTDRKHSRCNWLDLAPRFSKDHDCLAAFLALETAEVLAGEKPANLIRLNNRKKPCGRNLHQLWQTFGDSLLHGTNLKGICLHSSKGGKLLLFYAPHLLKRQLQTPAVADFLHKLGYPHTSNLQDILKELQLRFERETVGLPHEVGLFLGYPLKDVIGFMRRDKQPCTGRRLWYFYGDPAPSLALYERFSACRHRMAKQLQSSCNPLMLLQTTRTNLRELTST